MIPPASVDDFVELCQLGERRLASLVRQARGGNGTSGEAADVEASVADIRRFLNGFLPHVVHGDGTTSVAEHALVEGLGLRSSSVNLQQVPRFFSVLVSADKLKRTSYTLQALHALRMMGLAAAASDGALPFAEVDRIQASLEGLAYFAVFNRVCDDEDIEQLWATPANAAIAAMREDRIPLEGPAREQSVTPASKAASVAGGNEQPDLAGLLTDLDALVGLEAVKRDVRTLINLVRVRQMRSERNLKSPNITLHLAFVGNPGTGKTTVARILAKVYKQLGLLRLGHLVETDRSGLVAPYVGQTASRVVEVVKSALGGVLFIDEAYALVADRGEGDFGREAIDTLLKLMEDNRDDLIVIVAGYETKMAAFFDSNPGLKSRFNKYIRFPDYQPDELASIFRMMVGHDGYELTSEADAAATTSLASEYESRSEHFGNARLVRNFFESTIQRHADRVAHLPNPTSSQLSLIEPADLAIDAVRF